MLSRNGFLGLVVLMSLVGCGGGPAGFRETSPNRKWQFVLRNDPNQVNDQSRFLFYIVPTGQNPSGEALGRIRYTNLKDVPRMPVIKWLDDSRIEFKFLLDHSHTIPPSATVTNGQDSQEIKFLFTYPKQ